MKRSERIQRFVTGMWQWFASHKRELPWRDLKVRNKSERAYRVLVSEVMLQQTQVPRVRLIYRRFLEEFPTLNDLAKASNRDVLLAWRGMGYNSRALRLRDATRTVIEEFNGEIPFGMETLQSIKGIGHYTAAAIRNFAFNLPTPCLDTNIRRVLHRTFVGRENPDGTWKRDDKYLLKLAENVLEVALKERGRTTVDWHAALMDYGSLVCTKRNPQWDNCPLVKSGLVKASQQSSVTRHSHDFRIQKKWEPGRFVGSAYIPNRIFRGKIVEQLRDAPTGLSIVAIGRGVCLDWDGREHLLWLYKILEKLEKDKLIEKRRQRFLLKV